MSTKSDALARTALSANKSGKIGQTDDTILQSMIDQFKPSATPDKQALKDILGSGNKYKDLIKDNFDDWSGDKKAKIYTLLTAISQLSYGTDTGEPPSPGSDDDPTASSSKT